MKLEKFNLPRVAVDAISCAAPEIQGQVYAALFAFIYNGDTAAEASLTGAARAIYLLAKAIVEPAVARAVRAAERRAARAANATEAPAPATQPEPHPLETARSEPPAEPAQKPSPKAVQPRKTDRNAPLPPPRTARPRSRAFPQISPRLSANLHFLRPFWPLSRKDFVILPNKPIQRYESRRR